MIILGEADGGHPPGIASHRAHFGFGEAESLALFGHQDDLVFPLGQPCPAQFIPAFQADGDDAGGPNGR